MSHAISHAMSHLIPIQGSKWPALGLNIPRYICRFCSFQFTDHGPLPVLLQQPDSIATPAPPILPRPAGPLPPLVGLPWQFILGSRGCNPALHAEKGGMLCRCAAAHLCCAAAATAAQQAAGAPGNVCCIAFPILEIAVHAMMGIMMLRISRQR